MLGLYDRVIRKISVIQECQTSLALTSFYIYSAIDFILNTCINTVVAILLFQHIPSSIGQF